MKKRYAPILQRIPCDDICDFTELIEVFLEELEDMFALFSREEPETSSSEIAWVSVGWLTRENDVVFHKNGMEKFAFLIACMLFMMDHNTMDEEIAFEVKWDIMDFETGNYDDMFTPEELVYLNADIRKINAYLDEHPHLIEGVAEARAKAQQIPFP